MSGINKIKVAVGTEEPIVSLWGETPEHTIEIKLDPIEAYRLGATLMKAARELDPRVEPNLTYNNPIAELERRQEAERRDGDPYKSTMERALKRGIEKRE